MAPKLKRSDSMASTIDNIAQAADILLQEDSSFVSERSVWTKRLGKLQSQNSSLKDKIATSRVREEVIQRELQLKNEQIETIDGDLRMVRLEKTSVDSELSKARDQIKSLKAVVQAHEEKELLESQAHGVSVGRLEAKLAKAQTLLSTRNGSLEDSKTTIRKMNEERVKLMNEHQQQLDVMDTQFNEELQGLKEKHHSLISEQSEKHRVDLVMANERTAQLVAAAEEKDTKLRTEHEKIVINLQEEQNHVRRSLESAAHQSMEKTSSNIKELREQLSSSELEISRLQLLLSRTEEEGKRAMENKESSIVALVSDHDDAVEKLQLEFRNKTVDAHDEFETKLNNANARVTEVEGVSSKLRNELLDSQLLVSGLESQTAQLADEKVRLQRKVGSLEEELKRTNSHNSEEIENKTRVLLETSSKLSTLELKHKSQVTEAKKLSAQLTHLSEVHAQLETDMSNLELEYEQNKKSLLSINQVAENQTIKLKQYEEHISRLESVSDKSEKARTELMQEANTLRSQVSTLKAEHSVMQQSIEEVQESRDYLEAKLKQSELCARETQERLKDEASKSQEAMAGWLKQSRDEAKQHKQNLEKEKRGAEELNKAVRRMSQVETDMTLGNRNEKLKSYVRIMRHRLKSKALKTWKLFAVVGQVMSKGDQLMQNKLSEVNQEREDEMRRLNHEHEDVVTRLEVEKAELIASSERLLADLGDNMTRDFDEQMQQLSLELARLEGLRVSDQLEFLETRHALEAEIHHLRGSYLVRMTCRRRQSCLAKGWSCLRRNSVVMSLKTLLNSKHGKEVEVLTKDFNKQLGELRDASTYKFEEAMRANAAKVGTLEQDLARMTRELQQSNREIVKLTRKFEDSRKSFEDELEAAKVNMEEGKQQRDGLRIALSEATRAIHLLQAEVDDANQHLDAMRKRQSECEIKVRETSGELDLAKSLGETLTSTTEKLTAKLKNAMKSLEMSKAETREVRAELEEVISDREQCQHSVSAGQVKVKNLENLKSRLQTLVDDLQKDVEKLESSEAGLKRDLRRQEQRNSDVVLDLETSEAKLDKSTAMRRGLEDQVSKVTAQHRESCQCLDEERSALKKLKAEVKDLGLKLEDSLNKHALLQRLGQKNSKTHQLKLLHCVLRGWAQAKVAAAWKRWSVRFSAAQSEFFLKRKLDHEHRLVLEKLRQQNEENIETKDQCHDQILRKEQERFQRKVEFIEQEHRSVVTQLEEDRSRLVQEKEAINEQLTNAQELYLKNEIKLSEDSKRRLMISNMWAKWLLFVVTRMAQEKTCTALTLEFQSAKELLQLENNGLLADANQQHDRHLLDIRNSYEQAIAVLKQQLSEANERATVLMTRTALVQGQLRDAEKAVAFARRGETALQAEIQEKLAEIECERKKTEVITKHLGVVQSRLLSWGLNPEGFSKVTKSATKHQGP